MIWVIIGLLFLILPIIIENINAQKEREQEIIDSAYQLFEDEDLRALTKEEQEIAWDNAWQKFGNKSPETQTAYIKIKDLIRKGAFTND